MIALIGLIVLLIVAVLLPWRVSATIAVAFLTFALVATLAHIG